MLADDMVYIGQACGKIIVSGEHSVVYGKPCIASSIPLYLKVFLQKKFLEESTSIQLCYRDNTQLTVDERLKDAIHHVIPHNGWNIRIQSDIPFSSGMGSSAAFAVALLRAWASAQSQNWTEEVYLQKAHEIECFFHGTPSGIDHTVIFHDACIWFQKNSSGTIQMYQTKIPDLHLVVINSQIKGNTKEQVEKVRQNTKKNNHTIEEIGTCTEAIHDCIDRLYKYTIRNKDLSQSSLYQFEQQNLGSLFVKNHQLLQQLGVSHPVLDEIVTHCVHQGCLGAKMAGSGGGGIVFAYVNTKGKQIEITETIGGMGYDAFPLTLSSLRK